MLARIHRNLLLERRLPVTAAAVEALIPARGDLDFRKFWAPGPHNGDCRKIGSIWACIFFMETTIWTKSIWGRENSEQHQGGKALPYECGVPEHMVPWSFLGLRDTG